MRDHCEDVGLCEISFHLSRDVDVDVGKNCAFVLCRSSSFTGFVLIFTRLERTISHKQPSSFRRLGMLEDVKGMPTASYISLLSTYNRKRNRYFYRLNIREIVPRRKEEHFSITSRGFFENYPHNHSTFPKSAKSNMSSSDSSPPVTSRRSPLKRKPIESTSSSSSDDGSSRVTRRNDATSRASAENASARRPQSSVLSKKSVTSSKTSSSSKTSLSKSSKTSSSNANAKYTSRSGGTNKGGGSSPAKRVSQRRPASSNSSSGSSSRSSSSSSSPAKKPRSGELAPLPLDKLRQSPHTRRSSWSPDKKSSSRAAPTGGSSTRRVVVKDVASATRSVSSSSSSRNRGNPAEAENKANNSSASASSSTHSARAVATPSTSRAKDQQPHYGTPAAAVGPPTTTSSRDHVARTNQEDTGGGEREIPAEETATLSPKMNFRTRPVTHRSTPPITPPVDVAKQDSGGLDTTMAPTSYTDHPGFQHSTGQFGLAFGLTPLEDNDIDLGAMIRQFGSPGYNPTQDPGGRATEANYTKIEDAGGVLAAFVVNLQVAAPPPPVDVIELASTTQIKLEGDSQLVTRLRAALDKCAKERIVPAVPTIRAILAGTPATDIDGSPTNAAAKSGPVRDYLARHVYPFLEGVLAEVVASENAPGASIVDAFAEKLPLDV
ncbi:unnamed protein product [Amoebophrya sp. A25]|nr:unnamed protein product [Amoebophrya sp. A25]|eukprot:GSA25T00012262001.1